MRVGEANMVDPITAFGAATAAFSAIKKGFEIGRDVESMYGDIERNILCLKSKYVIANK